MTGIFEDDTRQTKNNLWWSCISEPLLIFQQARISFSQKYMLCALFFREDNVNSPTTSPIGRLLLTIKKSNIVGCHARSSFLWSVCTLKSYALWRRYALPALGDISEKSWAREAERRPKGACVITGNGTWACQLGVTPEEADRPSNSMTTCLQRGWGGKEKSNTPCSPELKVMQAIVAPLQKGRLLYSYVSFPRISLF